MINSFSKFFVLLITISFFNYVCALGQKLSTTVQAESQTGTLIMDDLVYSYIPGTDKLLSVTDSVDAGAYTGDVDGQNDHEFDENGNLIRITSPDGVTEFVWGFNGKVKRATHGNMVLEFIYDAQNRRVKKTVIVNGNIISDFIYVYGVPAGPAVYVKTTNGYVLTEMPVSNMSGRLATASMNAALTPLPQTGEAIISTRRLEAKKYEINDHLNNVNVLVSDVKFPVGNGSFKAEVTAYENFYAFGMSHPARGLKDYYRYSYNGYERDNEISSLSGGARFYNPAIARFTSLDPKRASFPGMSAFAFAANNPIYYVDKDGENPVVAAVAVGVIKVGLGMATNYMIQRRTKKSEDVDWNDVLAAGILAGGPTQIFGLGKVGSMLVKEAAGIIMKAGVDVSENGVKVAFVNKSNNDVMVDAAAGVVGAAIGQAAKPITEGIAREATSGIVNEVLKQQANEIAKAVISNAVKVPITSALDEGKKAVNQALKPPAVHAAKKIDTTVPRLFDSNVDFYDVATGRVFPNFTKDGKTYYTLTVESVDVRTGMPINGSSTLYSGLSKEEAVQKAADQGYIFNSESVNWKVIEK